MRVALTGVSGFIGAFTARGLVAAGHTVNGLVRPESRRDHIEDVVDRFVVGEQDDESAWPALLDGADVVVHNSFDWLALRSGDHHRHLRSNLVGSIGLLESSRPRPFILIGSVASLTRILPAWRGVIDESHPLIPGSAYGATKAAIEAHLWSEHHSEGRVTCSLRPCAVYGIDPNLERSIGHDLLRTVRDGQPYSRPGGGKFVHVDDVVHAIVAAIDNPAVAGRAFNLVDCYARWADWASMAARLLDVEIEVDESSPTQPKNHFDVTAARTVLGTPLNRGHDGIMAHLRALSEA